MVWWQSWPSARNNVDFNEYFFFYCWNFVFCVYTKNILSSLWYRMIMWLLLHFKIKAMKCLITIVSVCNKWMVISWIKTDTLIDGSWLLFFTAVEIDMFEVLTLVGEGLQLCVGSHIQILRHTSGWSRDTFVASKLFWMWKSWFCNTTEQCMPST